MTRSHHCSPPYCRSSRIFTTPTSTRLPDGAVLRFACRVGDRDLEGVDILRFGADGLITEFTVMVRPYSAATALRERMAALLAGG